MKKFLVISGILVSFFNVSSAFAQFIVKIDLKHVDSDSIVSREVETQYNRDVTYVDQTAQRKYVLRISPVKTLKVNGQDLNPIQFDLKVYDAKENLITRPQTVTTFYRPEANFTIASKSDLKKLETGIKVTILQ